MPAKPITRYYNYNLTFRWIRGENHVVVKKGYVCEGHAVLVRSQPRRFKVQDLPGVDPHNDQNTWVATFPIPDVKWDDDAFFKKKADQWACRHPNIADLSTRTDTKG